MQLGSDDGSLRCAARLVLVVVLVIVIDLYARVFDYEGDDEDDNRTTLAFPFTWVSSRATLRLFAVIVINPYRSIFGPH